MASPLEKARQVDQFNEEFIQLGIKINKKTYQRFYNKVLLEATKGKKRKSARQIRKIINNTKINERGFIQQTFNSVLLAGITEAIEKPPKTKKEKESLVPILAILAFYGNKPTLIAEKTQKMARAFISGDKSNLNERDKKIFNQFDRYWNKNKKLINKMLVNSRNQVKSIHKRIKSTTSKAIVKTLKQEVNKQVSEAVFKDGKWQEKKRFQSAKEVKESVRNKFDEQVDWRVERVLDTEIKTIEEETKWTKHTLEGYTHKTWRTKRDNRVRPTHRKLEGVTIPIDKKFRVGRGWGMYPGDPSLPPEERINERCTLLYSKRS